MMTHHVLSTLFLTCLACGALVPVSHLACVCVIMCVVGPRLAWRTGSLAEGVLYVAALAVYWNFVYLVSFTSPLAVAMCCWFWPRVSVPLLCGYVLNMYVTKPEFRDGRPWEWFSCGEWGYHSFRRFIRLRVHVTEALRARPVDKKIMVGLHPHGIASDYRILMDGIMYEALPGRPLFTLAATVLFCVPIIRELCLWTRCIDARKQVALRALRKGHSLMVIPGGEKEMIDTKSGVEEVYLKTRKGFVKLALEADAALVPTYVFGCVDLYDTYTAFFAPREWLRKTFGVCIPLYRGTFGFIPKRVPCDVVMGEPLEVTCAVPGAPTDEEVSAAHDAYVRALCALFDQHKGRFGYSERELKVM